ncbi:MAG: SCO family protein, partial [Betaproteobacteria bacterium]
FDPSFLGLYGDEKTTADVAKEFKIIYQQQPGRESGSYTVDHSAGTYIFDPQGRLRVYENYAPGPEVYAHDLREVLKPAA